MSDSSRTDSAGGASAADGVDDVAMAHQLLDAYHRVRQEAARVIVGQDQALEQMLIAILCRGHCILEGVPGLAKTLMISSLARTLSLSFSRIQFTPDLMPSDITGTEVIDEDRVSGRREFRFVRGPVFANVVLADEINRTPPKTQAALLEAMQEHQVTIGGEAHRLPSPFFVLATQNPIEQEGTYPLPEAQLDRFMFKVRVQYPREEEEFEIVQRTTAGHEPHVQVVLDAEEIVRLQEMVRRVPVADHIIRYAMRFARLTRRIVGDVPSFINEYVTWGAGPRASQFLILAAKALAVLRGRLHVAAEDIRAVAHPVLRHRIITNFNAEAEGVSADQIVDWLIRDVPEEEATELKAAGADKLLSG